MNTLTQEIFSVGKWNGFEFTLNDLRKMATSFDSLKEVLQVPLKFGHNDDQPMTDGQPALGWVSDIYVKGQKLVAEFSDIPDIVYNAMERGMYRNVSVELDFDVNYKNSFYDFVLTGVALLGADLPAVNNLNSLTKYMARDSVHAFSKKENADYYAAVSHKSFTMGDNDMNEIEKLKADLEKAKMQAKLDSEKFATERKSWEAAEKERKAHEAEVKFLNDKTGLELTLEKLVEEKRVFPAQRDAILKDLSPENIEQRQFTVKVMGDSPDDKDLNKGQRAKGSSTSANEEDGRPDEILMQKVAAAQLATPGMSFSNAKHAVFRANPELATRYFRMDGMQD